jgi:hypothetical protein
VFDEPPRRSDKHLPLSSTDCEPTLRPGVLDADEPDGHGAPTTRGRSLGDQGNASPRLHHAAHGVETRGADTQAQRGTLARRLAREVPLQGTLTRQADELSVQEVAKPDFSNPRKLIATCDHEH